MWRVTGGRFRSLLAKTFGVHLCVVRSACGICTQVQSWDIGSIAFYLVAGIYLYARLVSPRIPESGEIELQCFSFRETPRIPHRGSRKAKG
jgi:hypothetical protein